MDRQEIEAKVKEFLIEDLEIDEEKIQPEARLKEDIGIDSLDFVDIVVIVEKKFGFKIKTEEMANVKTFNDFCDYLILSLLGVENESSSPSVMSDSLRPHRL